MPRFLIELVKHVRDAAEPLTLIAFLAIIILGCAWAVLRALPGFLRTKPPLSGNHKYLLCKQLISSFFWLAMAVFIFGFGLDALVKLYKASLPPPPSNVTKEEPKVTPPVQPPPTQPQHQYKLVWYNHYQSNQLWEVKRTDLSVSHVGNDLFQSWCIPFDETKYVVHQRRQIAGDEQFKEPQNWWVAEPYKLPALNKRWLEIMDDERWYFYDVVPK